MTGVRPILGLTLGDPAGVGPEVAAEALSDSGVLADGRVVIIGDEAVFREAAHRRGVRLDPPVIGKEQIDDPNGPALALFPVGGLAPADREPGQPTLEGGRAAGWWVETAARLALEGKTDGLVTGPISKEALIRAGYPYPGHTPFLAALAGGADVVMMLAGPRLRVVLVTIHIPLADVPRRLTRDAILKTASITYRALKEDFGLPEPRLAVCGLNPHAGEGGLLGSEEETVIIPAAAEAGRLGIPLSGPHPADTLFFRAVEGEFDAVIAMYHDQGLIPLKLLHFRDGVNITLGLPFVRTSVDHGTAYSLAGRNLADASSMKEAIRTAIQMVLRRKTGRKG